MTEARRPHPPHPADRSPPDDSRHRPRPAGHRHHPDALDRCRPEGEFRAPRRADGGRTVLGAGHASMLLYALLFLTGYEVSLEDLESFRQLGSITPGHPEYGLTPGVEATTGPLGQGFANAVGMAIAERRLAHEFNGPGQRIVDHRTYVIASDGDMQEGIASEAA